MSQPLLPQPHSNSLLPPPGGLVPPGNAGRIMPTGNMGAMMPPGNPGGMLLKENPGGMMPPGNPGVLMTPTGGLIPPSSLTGGPPGVLMPPSSSTGGPPGVLMPPSSLTGGPPGVLMPPSSSTGGPPGVLMPPSSSTGGPPGVLMPPSSSTGGPPGVLMPPSSSTGGPPGVLMPPSSSTGGPPGVLMPPSSLTGGPSGGLMPPISGPPADGLPHLIREGSMPSGPAPSIDATSPSFTPPPQLGLRAPSAAVQAVQPPPIPLTQQPGPAQGGPRMPPPPHMRFPPPGQLPPSASGMGPDGPRPLMGLLPPGQQRVLPQGHPPPGTPPPEIWFEHKTSDGHTYYSHSQSRQTTWERPLNAQIIPQPRPGQPMGAVPGFPPSIPFSPPGAPQLVPTRVWSEHQTPDGKMYFYNKVTRQSVWEKPRDFELIMPLPISFSQPPPTATATGDHVPGPLPVSQSDDGSQQNQSSLSDSDASGVGMEVPNESEQEQLSDREMDQSQQLAQEDSEPSSVTTSLPPSSLSLQEQPSEPQVTAPPVPSSPLLKPPVPVSYVTATVPPTRPEQQQQQQPPPLPPMRKERSGPHPIKSVPVPGTPWSIVWSSDERIFFFNATTRVSLWSMPDDLKTNPQVEKILDEPVAGKKRVGAIEPTSDAKRFKGEDDVDSDMEEDDNTEQKQVGLQEDSIESLSAKVQSDAADIEKKAAAVRAGKSLEERQKEFHEMLLERGVSAFSTWEKELPKFVFDPRYLLLNTKERKACFESFIRVRAEEERKERKTKLKEKRDVFRNLLEEAKLHAKSSFSEFASKYSKDSRFKAIEKMREREQMFTDYLTELKKASKHKEDHHRHSSSKSKAEKIKSEFLAMLGESDAITERSQWRKMKTLFDRDPRYKAVESSSQREEWFKGYVKEITSRVDPEQERMERIQASLKEREREVKMSRSAHEKEWGRERDQLRKAEATQHFKALLVDMVRNSEAVWQDTKQSLKKDHRWGLADQLEPTEKEKLFQDHVEGLFEKKRLQFRRLLEDTTQISLTMPWKKTRKLIKEDPRYKNFGQHDHRREMEYDRYLRDKMVEAKNEFRTLLKETKIITYRSHELIRESEKHHKDIIDILKNDQRYLVLDCVADERKRMLEDYVYELHQRGPPPPPTATNPSERLKRPLVN